MCTPSLKLRPYGAIQICLLLLLLLLLLIDDGSLGPGHVNRFSRFCRADARYQLSQTVRHTRRQTDREAHRPRYETIISGPIFTPNFQDS